MASGDEMTMTDPGAFLLTEKAVETAEGNKACQEVGRASGKMLV